MLDPSVLPHCTDTYAQQRQTSPHEEAVGSQRDIKADKCTNHLDHAKQMSTGQGRPDDPGEKGEICSHARLRPKSDESVGGVEHVATSNRTSNLKAEKVKTSRLAKVGKRSA